MIKFSEGGIPIRLGDLAAKRESGNENHTRICSLDTIPRTSRNCTGACRVPRDARSS